MLNQGKPIFLTRTTTNNLIAPRRLVEDSLELLRLRSNSFGFPRPLHPLYLERDFNATALFGNADKILPKERQFSVCLVITPDLIASEAASKLKFALDGVTHPRAEHVYLNELTEADLDSLSSASTENRQIVSFNAKVIGRELDPNETKLLFRHMIILQDRSPLHLGSEAARHIGVDPEIVAFLLEREEKRYMSFESETRGIKEK